MTAKSFHHLPKFFTHSHPPQKMIEFLIHIHVNGNSSVGKVKNSKSSKKSCNPSVTDKKTDINTNKLASY